MPARICPVCGLEQHATSADCPRCGWDFPLVLGGAEAAQAFLGARVEQARSEWRRRRYSRELIPELNGYRAATWAQFAEGLTVRPWYVGEGKLQWSGYDSKTNRFPLRIEPVRPWALPWLPGSLVSGAEGYSLELSLDPARELYHRSRVWPLYAYLVVRNLKVALERLALVTPEGELRVNLPNPSATQAAGSAPSQRRTAESGDAPTPSQQTKSKAEFKSKVSLRAAEMLIGGRYRDLGDGTVLDTRTGLQWMRCALGQWWDGVTCAGNADQLRWAEIFLHVEVFNRKGGFAGHADWRVPTINELKTVILEGKEPAIYQDALPLTGRFWSSSSLGFSKFDAPELSPAPTSIRSILAWVKRIHPIGRLQPSDAEENGRAWGVDFFHGKALTYPKEICRLVRLLRDA